MAMRRDVYETLLKKVEPYKQKEERRVKDANLRKSYDLVFDHRTLLTLYHLISKGHISTVDYPISTGKEAVVFHATGCDGTPYALKVYMITRTPFKGMAEYIMGDPRFKGLKGRREEIIYAWSTKEFKNLQRMHEAGVRVPMPFFRLKNVLLMEFIGGEGPAPIMKDFFSYLKREGLGDEIYDVAERFYIKLGSYMKAMVGTARIVHGDMSEYNVLVNPLDSNYDLIIIDVGQGVVLAHPNSKAFLERDLSNVQRYFTSLGLGVEVLEGLWETVMETYTLALEKEGVVV